MNNIELLHKIREILNTKKKSKDFLIKLGTHNSDGTLTKKYGGEYTLNDNL